MHPRKSSLLRLRLLTRDKRLPVARPDAHVGKDLFRPQLDGGDVGRLIRNPLLQLL